MKKLSVLCIALISSIVSVAHADPAAGVEASRDFCVQQDGGTNPGTIACDQNAIKEADQLITTTIARLKAERLTGKDAHGVDLSQGQAILDQAQVAFEMFRTSSSQLASIVDGGTGSDREVAKQELAWKLTIERLKDLEASLGN